MTSYISTSVVMPDQDWSAHVMHAHRHCRQCLPTLTHQSQLNSSIPGPTHCHQQQTWSATSLKCTRCGI